MLELFKKYLENDSLWNNNLSGWKVITFPPKLDYKDLIMNREKFDTLILSHSTIFMVTVLLLLAQINCLLYL